MKSYADRAIVREVGLRDGLQAEDARLDVEAKKRLYDALVAAGERHIEITSFVSPRAIPQLADAEALLEAVGPHPDVGISALVPNVRGAERALKAGVDEITVFLSASETHNQENVNQSVAASLENARAISALVREAGTVAASAVIATSFACPYEGPQDPQKVSELAFRLREMGFHPILFGDTIGAASPSDVARLLDQLSRHLPVRETGLHFHNTRGAALAGVLVGLDYGVALFDGSVGGMGGCPYAPGATGNVATEDIVAMLEGMDIHTGIDLAALVRAAHLAEGLVGRMLPSATARAFDAERGAWKSDVH